MNNFIKPSAELKIAIEASKAAAEVIKKYYQGSFQVEIKNDQTPVTEVDIQVEKIIKEIILNAFPDHGFYGEETNRENHDSDFLWLVDPIDGTKGFVRGYPFFSTQIALMHKSQIVLGVSNAPIFEEIIFAELGKGSWIDNHRTKVSKTSKIESSTISTGNLKSLALSEKWSNFGKIVSRIDRIRGYGDFYHYHLLATGKIDAVIESDVNILDVAALSIIISESGGVFTDLNGKKPDLNIKSILAANPILHPEIKSHLDGRS